MSLQQWLGIGALILLVAFVWFAFRQGTKVKPDDRPDRGEAADRQNLADGH
jgi:hypothetical protein